MYYIPSEPTVLLEPAKSHVRLSSEVSKNTFFNVSYEGLDLRPFPRYDTLLQKFFQLLHVVFDPESPGKARSTLKTPVCSGMSIKAVNK